MSSAETVAAASCADLGRQGLPLSIVDHRASGLLDVTWPDGRTDRLPHALLRRRCRCSGCEQLRRQDKPAAVSADVRITDIRPVADKGLNLVFSDGHGRGIFPWAYLHEIAAEAA